MGDSTADRRPALLVFSDDWGRHPSSCQHLVRGLLTKHRVLWVNTIGMRRPALDRVTVVRTLGKLREWVRPRKNGDAPVPNLRVLSPKMWPWFTRPHDRWLNRLLLLRQLVPVVRSLECPVIAVTTIPVVADLIGRLPVARWVYYCVDDFRKWPGFDPAAIERMEGLMVRSADVLLTVSETLQDRLSQWGKECCLLTHGVDLDHWQSAAERSAPPGLERLERPLVVFWGLVDLRLDAQFVARLAGEMSRGTIVLLGPEANPDPRLTRLNRVVRLPAVPYEQLPSVAREAAVLVMPYGDLPVTRAMQPLKLKEYLATGKPVVVRDLPANRPWHDALDLARTPEQFSAMVRQRLVGGLPEDQAAARLRLVTESWTEKTRQFEQIVMVGLAAPAEDS